MLDAIMHDITGCITASAQFKTPCSLFRAPLDVTTATTILPEIRLNKTVN